MKKIFIVFIFLLVLLTVAFANTYGIFEYEDSWLDDGSVHITSCTPAADQTTIIIPEEINSKHVSAIESGWGFWLGDFLVSDTVTEIMIPASVTRIDGDAFAQATALESIVVDSQNPTYATIQGILYDKNNKTIVCYPRGREDSSFSIPEGIRSVGAYSFYGTENLSSVYLPDSIEIIYSNAFEDSAITKVNIPEGVTGILSGAFFNCNSLTKLELPSTLVRIGSEAFICRSLESIEVSPDNPEYCSVDGVLFSKNMTELIAFPASKELYAIYTVPENTKSIAVSAFCYARLNGIILPDGIEVIGDSAFWGAWIDDMTLPDSLTYIGEGIFDNCNWIKSIYVTEGSYAYSRGLESDWGKYLNYAPSWL